MAATGDLYMGFDLSTQQCKCLVVSSDLKLAHSATVDFDADLSHHGIKKGVLRNDAENEIFAPVAMWLEALDLVLSRLQAAGLDFSRVKGVAGAGMQHGTVFWGPKAEEVLGGLQGGKGLSEQLCGPGGDDEECVRMGVFSHAYSPNWQDASTQKQCEEFDLVLGGPEELARVTGSKAHHRFSGPQIMRFRQKYPEYYKNTSRISLVSSFLASVFLGRVAPIDISDVCGMDLWEISKGAWNEGLLSLAAGGKANMADLKQKLGHVPEDGGGSFGPISQYFVSRYGFNKECAVIPSTGDNPSTMLALPMREGDAIVSLGTSTTFLMSTPQYKPDPAYHFMNHPTTAGLYMFMLCYKNGGLAREKVRDALNATTNSADSKSWDAFNATALSTPVLGQADDTAPMKLGLFFPLPEIVPNLRAGHWRFNYSALNANAALPNALEPVTADSAAWGGAPADARAIVESQFLSCRLRSAGLVSAQTDPASGAALPPQPRRVYLVGGGSQNAAIADLCGQVLGGAEGVYRLDIGGNACALGAAYKAVWGVERGGESFETLIEKRWDEAGFVKKIAQGYRKGVWERYGVAVRGFEEVERRVLREERAGTGRNDVGETEMGSALSRGRDE
ncbi:uncharacterized protein K452DRAFT_318310 [Aplosporella prunicola CBS 121167]|uniref:Xylulose kinase n=1 Tax=Aplosporella prunicola CBS 121167 TaxID=1176127 RepID=A0A6A6BD15_9PEZI|nr:uncharacterized protein K452DRAFT_318310 [Aplosporella prunicola CBS 121167]KAF2141966.1 hypothetical protein K452DRAFT_318310 [Aplosporella prunicola CBS 121167]